MILRFCLFFCLSLVLTACGGSGGESTNGNPNNETDAGGVDGGDAGANNLNNRSDGGDVFPTCTPDPALIAAAPSCRFDSDCPCGSSCDLGRCLAECSSDADCEGTTCSTRGVCGGTEPGDATLTTDDLGWFEVNPRVISPLANGEFVDLELVARGSGVDRFRITASEGLSLECDGAASTSACLIETPVAAGESFAVRVIASAAPTTDVRFVELHTAGKFQSISVQQPEEPSTAVLNSNPAGTWSGSMRVVREGYGGNESFLTEAPRRLDVPITAEIHTDSGSSQGVFVVREELGVFHPSGEWAANLDLSGAANTAEFPAFQIGGTLEVGALTVRLVSAPTVDLEFSDFDRALAFDLVVVTEGSLYEGGQMERHYRVRLRRDGDLPAGATVPTVLPPSSLTQTRRQVLDPLPSEAYVYDAIHDRRDATFQDLVDRFSQQHTNELETCTLDSFDHQWTHDVWLESWIHSDERLTLSQWRQKPGSAWNVWATTLQGLTVNGQPAIPPTAQVLIRTGFLEPTSGNSWPLFDIPCDYTIEGATLATDAAACGVASVTIPEITVNDCAAQKALHSCEIVDDPYFTQSTVPSSGGLNWGPYFSVTGSAGACRSFPDQENRTTVRRVCRLPGSPATCAEAMLCNTGTPQSQIDFRTGEFMCQNAGHGVAVSADVRAALAPPNDPVTTQDVLTNCLAELGAIIAGPPAGMAPDVAAALAPSNCINPVRFFSTLGVALHGNRYQDSNWALFEALIVDYEMYGRVPRNERIAMRLIQRWLELHGMLAREPAEREILGAIVREESQNLDVLALTEALQVSLHGWELFYHPRFALPLARLTDESMLSTDWRTDLDPNLTVENHHNYDRGLAVAVLETLESQLKLAEILLEQASFASDLSALENIKTLLRDAEWMRTWAAGFYARAQQAAANNGQMLAWQPDYERSRSNVDRQLLQTINLARSLKRGSNPLGIEDSDLPLYFFGGQTDPTDRFSAISDFLVGRPGTPSLGWAQQLVDSSEESFAASRAKWDTLRQREWMEELSDVTQQQERERDMRLSYGDKINDLCFLDTASSDVLDLQTLSPQSCFIDDSVPTCRFDMRGFAERVRLEDVELQVCIAMYGEAQVPGGLSFDDSRMETLRQLYVNEEVTSVSYNTSCPEFADEEAGCVVAETRTQGTVKVPVTPNSLRLRVPGEAGVGINNATQFCRQRHPNARRFPRVPNRLENPRCLRGAMGETALTILSAATDVEIAVEELGERTQAYNIAMNRCIDLQESATAIENARNSHANAVDGLRAGKLAADLVANIAGGAKDCLNSAQNAAGDAVSSAGSAVALSVGVCVAAGVETAANATSIGLEASIAQAELEHDNTLDNLERSADVDACKAEAELELVGVKSAEKRIQKAKQDMVVAQYRLDQQKREVSVLFEEGKAELEWIVGRKVTPPTGELWLDEDVERFRRRMRLARRVTYLSVQALEYEFQASLAARGAVLTASKPQDLQDILNELRTASGTRGINGNRPTDLKIVMSLRDNLLQLHDRTTAPEGWTALNQKQRFREMLLSERYRAYDDTGAFVGLSIPFELAPLEALGLGQTNGIGIFSQNDCAERIWSANASVVGSDAVLRGGATFTRMDLLKRNTFYSQWCSEPTAGQDQFQYASVRPSQNLFREPGLGSEFGESNLGVVKSTEVFTRARMQPAVNISRAEFENDDYENGQTSELAARGLYGDYALFIPANMLSRDENNVLTDGLDLQELDDILIRFDYLSVAK